jgi:hypothetical protein
VTGDLELSWAEMIMRFGMLAPYALRNQMSNDKNHSNLYWLIIAEIIAFSSCNWEFDL